MNPMIVAQARTRRLVIEATTPVYTSDAASDERKRIALISEAERDLCTEDFCFVCGRVTDHFGEHSDEQILRAARRRR